MVFTDSILMQISNIIEFVIQNIVKQQCYETLRLIKMWNNILSK